MRTPVRMLEKEEEDVSKTKKLVSEIVEELAAYIKAYLPEKMSNSKHSVMGPVGKLLGVLESGRFENKEALLGYIINIHNNTARSKISSEDIQHLSNALDLLEDLRSIVNVRTWIRLIREIDYAVYKKKMEQILKVGGE